MTILTRMEDWPKQNVKNRFVYLKPEHEEVLLKNLRKSYGLMKTNKEGNDMERKYIGFRVYGDERATTGPGKAVLHMWDDGDHMSDSHWNISYQLNTQDSYALFNGDGYRCPKDVAIDSDACFDGLMGFLCLRPGDTDKEHFANYTPEQLNWTLTNDCYEIEMELSGDDE